MTMPQSGSERRGLPSGLRKLTPAIRATERAADAFGRCAERPSKALVLATIKRAARPLGLNASEIALVDLFYAFSQPQDWTGEQQPLVWPSNHTLAHELGLSLSQVHRLIRRLCQARLIAPVDSPSGRRGGERDREGNIIWGYGFDLSPAAMILGDLQRAAASAKAERLEQADLLRRATIARKALRQILECAAELGLAAIAATAQDCLATPRRPKGLREDVERLEEEVERLRCAFDEAISPVDETIEMTPSGAIHATPITATTNPISHCDTSNRHEARRSERPSGPGLSSRLVLKACPVFRDYLEPNAAGTWSDIVEAAERLTIPLGIHRSAWTEAVGALGRESAAVCLAITLQRRRRLKSCGGYLRGMTRNLRAGGHDLARSLFGLLAEGDGRQRPSTVTPVAAAPPREPQARRSAEDRR